MSYEYSGELWEAEGRLRDFFATESGRQVATGVFLFLMGLTVILLAVAVVLYIFQSLSLYKIAKRRGLRLYGFAWVPVLVSYTIGSISDDYDMKVNGIARGRRKLLLGLSIAAVVMGILMNIMTLVLTRTVSINAGSSSAVVAAIIVFLVAIVYLALVITHSVFIYISLYKIYKSCSPASCVVFTVLGILFGVTMPIFLFVDRNKDLGMPAVQALPEENAEIIRHNERDYNA